MLIGLMSLAALKKKNSKRQVKVHKDKDDESTGNSELRALEAHMLRLSKQGRKTLEYFLLFEVIFHLNSVVCFL